jgi:lipopolysaccharide export LptBFGC system permease protein LptF
MQFMWKYIDDLLGKGLSSGDILELMGYHTLWTIPYSLPVSILIASVMVYGDLAEKYELASFKSAGISLIRVMRPGIFMSIFTFFLSLFASNYIVPVALFKFSKKFDAIKQQKSALAIEESIFNDDFDNFVIRTGKKMPNGRDMKDVYISDQSKADRSMLNAILADSARMFVDDNKKNFIMELYNGTIYQEEEKKWKSDRQTYPFMRTSFKSYTKVLDMSEFKLNNSLDLFRSKEDMMNTFQLLDAIDSLKTKEAYHAETLNYDYAGVLKASFRPDSLKMYIESEELKSSKPEIKSKKEVLTGKSIVPQKVLTEARSALANTAQESTVPRIRQRSLSDLSKYKYFYQTLDSASLDYIFYRVETQANTRMDFSNNVVYYMDDAKIQAERLKLKLHNQYAFATICIIFLFIGAPLGSIIRKGGYGYPLLIAILFYVVFMITSIMGSKLLKSQTFGGVMSAWYACIIQSPFALYFTYKALRDSRFDEFGAFFSKIQSIFQQKKAALLLLLLTGPVMMTAQLLTPVDIKFYKDNKEIKIPQAGGLSAPQFMHIDLNRDGKKDLFVFDRNGNVPLAFINKGGAGEVIYEQDQKYLQFFPEIRIWCTAADFDGDGVEDLFKFPDENNISGIEVWKGKVEGGYLKFSKVKNPRFNFDVLTVSLSGQTVPVYMSFIDYPAILDVDGDGDLDILTFESGGSYVEYYKNLTAELGLPPDQFRYTLEDRCFGKFYEDQFSEKIKLSNNPDACATFNIQNPSSAGFRHTGSTVLGFDPDCDGDIDLLLGDVGSEYLTFLKNTGSKTKGFIGQIIERFPESGSSRTFIFGSSFYIDVNNDGKKDLITTVNEASNSQTNNFVYFYENTGDGCSLNYTLKSKNFLHDMMIDVGNSAHPLIFDADGDGLQDLILGCNGEISEGGKRKNQLYFFKNTGNKTKPEFSLVTDDFLGISALSQIYTKLSPATGDLDGDGDTDMIIGHSQGFLLYAENRAGSGKPPEFDKVKVDWLDIFAGQNASPYIIDYDGDGLQDLVIGKLNNNLNFYKNRGTPKNPVFNGFTPDETNLGKLFTGNNFDRQHGSPEFFRIKDQLYMLMGFSNGDVSLYELPAERNKDSVFKLLKNNILPFYLGRQVNAAISDIDNDGFFEVFVGNERGGLHVFKTDIETSKALTSYFNEDYVDLLKIYPNPTENHLIIEGDLMGSIQILDLTGSVMYNAVKDNFSKTFYLSELPTGHYLVKFISKEAVLFKKLILRGR